MREATAALVVVQDIDEGGACQFATRRNSLDDMGCHVEIQFAGCVVIEKEQGFGTGNHNIVDTHCDQINANAVMQVGLDGQFQLGANTICARDQYRFTKAIQR